MQAFEQYTWASKVVEARSGGWSKNGSNATEVHRVGLDFVGPKDC